MSKCKMKVDSREVFPHLQDAAIWLTHLHIFHALTSALSIYKLTLSEVQERKPKQFAQITDNKGKTTKQKR